ncbi:MAG: PP2C family protein-serine/threonine phosphatase [Planctomycetota bacterium]|jgi:serine phosphatase RsbU (regulator of sigma subunit)
MTGLGLMQFALLGGFIAVLCAVFGVVLAGSQEDPSLVRAADSIGAALCMFMTSHEPESWRDDAGTLKRIYKEVKEVFREEDLSKFPRLPTKVYARDHSVTSRNKSRLSRVMKAYGPTGRGAFQGLMIHATNIRILHSQRAGATVNPDHFAPTRVVPGGVEMAPMLASMPGGAGSFTARVYRTPYKDRRGTRVGHVYVILSDTALQGKGGAGAWLFLTPLLVACGVGVFVFAASRTAAGLQVLARDLDTIGRGKLDLRVTASGTGEVGYAQRVTERMVKNLQLIQSTGSGDLDEALEKELALANQIHQGLLPSDPPRLPGYELETLFKVGRDIGGDYHDYIELDETRLVIVLADCSESLRGVPAAMVMAMTRAYLKAAIDPGSGPDDWLKTVNRQLARDLKSGMAVTALLLALDSSTHEVVAASAGHRPIVIWRQNKTATINPNGIALGLDVGPVFEKTLEEKKFSIQKNDRLVLYTDGVISAENEEGEQYGEPRFHEAIRRQGAMNSAAFVNFIAGGVDKFLADAEQNDDITICTLKRMK